MIDDLYENPTFCFFVQIASFTQKAIFSLASLVVLFRNEIQLMDTLFNFSEIKKFCIVKQISLLTAKSLIFDFNTN